MTKLLSGAELQGFIKERQAKQVRNLRQEHRIAPKLVIVMGEQATDASKSYVRMKQAYAQDVLIDVEVVTATQADMGGVVAAANADDSVHGIIIQLPLDDPSKTKQMCDLIIPSKDVDGLGEAAEFPSATAEAIDWLLAGYNVELRHRKITIVGNGKLVGAPLHAMWLKRGLDVTVVDEFTENISKILLDSEIIVTATGQPGLLTSKLVPIDAIVIDAGTASEGGVIVGDVAPEVRERNDITITPEKGGVGPLTITLLFDHVIQVALKAAGKL